MDNREYNLRKMQAFWEKEWAGSVAWKIKLVDDGRLFYKGSLIATYNFGDGTCVMKHINSIITTNRFDAKVIKEDIEKSITLLKQSDLDGKY